ncbi:MAG: chorismate lyase / 3-hydroxybenzoate synthase [Gammaproteobacteria bacterium]|jgi:enamine deaminase RidA (YjgF/YER057c/UK114 family)|nr:chorismate lyase / 3-hydroxybenzoate synthase [Gammaproteobacteria bacterium]
MQSAALQLDYVSLADLPTQTVEWWRDVLGVVGFEKAPQAGPVQVPVTASMTPPLGATENLCEVWRVAPGRKIELVTGSFERGRVQYRYCDELLFGSITIDEEGCDGSASAVLQRATMTAYQAIFAVLEETQHRHLIRIWNYLPEINREADGDERYRHFNSARQAAFRDSGRRTVGSVPAASALGSPAGSPISIYFLASHEPPTMIENPRQISAYHYPPKFGTHSPIFSRACVLSESGGTNLFVSGTASIVGYETLHHGDVTAQTRETVANIDALLGEANRIVGGRYTLDDLKFKVYVRQPSDLRAIEIALSSRLHARTSIVYVQADVCREDLLVEIEATGEARCT